MDSLRTQLQSVLLNEGLCDLKPDFNLVLEVVADVNAGKDFAPGLYRYSELTLEKMRRTKRKVTFLVRLVAYVERVLGISLNVQPAQIVSGGNQGMVLTLLSAIAQASVVPPAQAKAAVKATLLYFKQQKNKAKAVIRTVTRLQSIWRGHRQRQQHTRNRSNRQQLNSAHGFQVPHYAAAAQTGPTIRLQDFLNAAPKPLQLASGPPVRPFQRTTAQQNHNATVARAKAVLRRMAGRRQSPRSPRQRPTATKASKAFRPKRNRSRLATHRVHGPESNAAHHAAPASMTKKVPKAKRTIKAKLRVTRVGRPSRASVSAPSSRNRRVAARKKDARPKRATTPVTPRTRLRQSRKKLREYSSGAVRAALNNEAAMANAASIYDKEWLNNFDFEFGAALDKAMRI